MLMDQSKIDLMDKFVKLTHLQDLKISGPELKECMAQFEKLCQENEGVPSTDFFHDATSDVNKAVLLFYMNSGYFRFDRYKEHDGNCHGQDVDIDSLKKEIAEEQLSGQELTDMTKKFVHSHSVPPPSSSLPVMPKKQ